jgi:hypothetical protein
MRKKWIGPVVGVVSLAGWVIVAYFLAAAEYHGRPAHIGITLPITLLLLSPLYLVAGFVAGVLCQYGVRRLRTYSTPFRLLLAIVALLIGVPVWLAAAGLVQQVMVFFSTG